MEYFLRGTVVEGSTRAIVEPVHRGVNVSLCFLREIRSLGEESTEFPIVPFVQTPIAGSVGASAVDRHLQGLRDLFVLRDFSAVVVRHRQPHMRGKMSERFAARSHHLIRRLIGDEDGFEVQTVTLRERRHRTTPLAIADHQITLPIPRPRFLVHFLRTLTDVFTIGNARPVLRKSSPFVLLSLVAKTLVQITSLLFITFNVGIDALMADRVCALQEFPPACDLIGALAIPQRSFHMVSQSSVVMPSMTIIVRIAPACLCMSLCGLRRVPSLRRRAVATQFPADGRLIATDDVGNALLRVTCTMQRL